MPQPNKWVYDIETYPNCFTTVARRVDSTDYQEFVIHDTRNDIKDLLAWLKTKPILIGYNSIDFDNQVIEYLWRAPNPSKITPHKIYEFVEDLFQRTDKDRFDQPFSEWDLSFRCIDLYKINHYDNPSRRTSLKWLEFTTRWPKLKDLPIEPGDHIPETKISTLLRYNKNDVDVTYNFYYICMPNIALRKEMVDIYHEPRIMNMSDSSMGAYIFKYILTQDYNFSKKALKDTVERKTIAVRDCLFPYIEFDAQPLRKVLHDIKNRVYDLSQGTVKDSKLTDVALFEDMAFVFGAGGVHASYKSGEYCSSETHTIFSADVASYYPNLAITGKIFPEHLGERFCQIYEEVYAQRAKYPKGSAMNYAIKIALNAVTGKSNNKYSIFYDPKHLLSITINGQLLLTMLAEKLAKFGRLLLVNTDGLEILLPKKSIPEVKEVCGLWEMLTGLTLEFNEYKKLIIRDVNNYIAQDASDQIKRKGMFELYEDIEGTAGAPHQYHKNPSATIIPKAVFNYFINDIPVIETVMNENNIHEFCYGIKKRKNFEYWLMRADENFQVNIKRTTERVLRYFISPKGSNVFKIWTDGRKNKITSVNKDQLVTLALNIPNKGAITNRDQSERYDIDRDYYMAEAEKTIDLIKSGARDSAYNKIKN